MTENSTGAGSSSFPNGRTIQEICREFEASRVSGEGSSIEMYLDETPKPQRAKLLQELVHSELLRLLREKEAPSLQEYLKRFPEYQQIINDVYAAVFTETIQSVEDFPADQGTIAGSSARVISTDKEETVLQTDQQRSADEEETLLQSERESLTDEETIVQSHRQGEAASDFEESASSSSKKFGDYDLLEVLGRGGMGVVYKARQRSADRLVALKLIRPDRLESDMSTLQQDVVERFQTEARAAAQLDHEHLVTIYEVGEIDNQHFYSMRYVEGKSLSELLREGPLEGRASAAYLEPVVRALAEAHSRGILHRDLKPQNILVDEKTQRALVMDFGLAKLTNEETDLTQSGEIMGTPQYMSPEQATDSANVTELTDVYALGATLYHMITGRPAFQAATVLETLRLVIDQEPVRPKLLNPAIEQDLETICLKCLEKEPAKRYATSGLLADELTRYLEGKPILARPIGIGGRSWRWAKRNKAVAGLLASTVTFILVAFVAVVVGYVQTAAAYRKVEESSRETRVAINEYFTTISEDSLLNQAGAHPLRKKLLTKAADFYQRFLEERKDDPTVRDEVAAAYFRVGRITKEIAEPTDSLQWLTQARRMQEQIVAERPDDLDAQFALGNTLNVEGEALHKMKRYDDALERFNQALKLRTRLTELDPARPEFQRTLANTHMNLGLVKGKIYFKKKTELTFDEAKEQMQTAQSIRSSLTEQNSNDLTVLRDSSKGEYQLAQLVFGKSPEDAESHLNASIKICQKILSHDETDLNQRSLDRKSVV